MFKKKVNYLDPLLVEKNERIFYIQNINKGDVVFDVGANIGELTLLFSKFAGPKGHVHAFEPTPKTFEKLKSLLAICGRQNVYLNNMAVTETSGTAMFNTYDEKHASWNTFANRPLKNYGIDIAPAVSIQVPTISIDKYCIKNSIDRIDLLKIDVEGAELSVLKGAQKMFEEKKIKLCVFEFGQTIFEMGNKVNDLQLFFKKNNFSVSNISKTQNTFPVDTKTKMGCFSILIGRPNRNF